MIIFLLIGLLLLGTAVVLITRGAISARLRTTDNLNQIGRYGFAGAPAEVETAGGFRGFFDDAGTERI